MTSIGLYEVLTAAGVRLDDRDQIAAEWIKRQGPEVAEAVAGWIERAWPDDARQSHERDALARIVDRVELTGANTGGDRLTLGIVLGLAQGGLRAGRPAAAANCGEPQRS